MTQETLIYYANSGLLIVLLLSMPPIIVATLIGLLVSLIQALTQLQEQTLAFAVKLLAIMITLIFVIPWGGRQLFDYAIQIFNEFPFLTR
ncbi:EscS/YscS/HrcS family type III secretion system export apparatus protein [Chromatiales bacterium (ex Bugula neritina AB1)]|nr:EscS/YscS/HrcS family type III secretion system export apparatus protein [Chromatiales bacterium (ex Bugula neritina AB1)]